MTGRFSITLLCAVACGGAAGPPPTPATNQVGPQTPETRAIDLRQIDWKNRTYAIPADNPDEVDLIAGTYEVVDGLSEWDRGGGDRGYFRVDDPSFGDVDGDGDEEAIVIVIANGGGSGHFSAGLIYTADGSAPRLLDSIPGGDRGAGGLREIAVVEPGVVRVVRNWLADGDGANNGSLIRIERWRWDGEAVVEDESAREQKSDTE